MNDVKVAAFGILKAYLPEETTVASGQTVGQAITSLELGTNEAIIAVINGQVASWNDMLEPGDELELVQGIGGG